MFITMTMMMITNALDHDDKMLMIMTMLMMIDSLDHDHGLMMLIDVHHHDHNDDDKCS